MPIKYKSQGIPKIPSDFRQVAEKLLGPVDWQNEDSGFCQSTGSHRHTAPNREHDCRVYLDAEDGYAPTIHCFHESCKDEVITTNFRLRSSIGKVTYRLNGHSGVVHRPN